MSVYNVELNKTRKLTRVEILIENDVAVFHLDDGDGPISRSLDLATKIALKNLLESDPEVLSVTQES